MSQVFFRLKHPERFGLEASVQRSYPSVGQHVCRSGASDSVWWTMLLMLDNGELLAVDHRELVVDQERTEAEAEAEAAEARSASLALPQLLLRPRP